RAATPPWRERARKGARRPGTVAAAPPAEPRQAVPAELIVELDGRRVPVRIFDHRRDTAPKTPSRHEAHHGPGVHSVIAAPMQGTILRVLVEEEQEIEAGDVICI